MASGIVYEKVIELWTFVQQTEQATIQHYPLDEQNLLDRECVLETHADQAAYFGVKKRN
ncbi:hypothetical protein OAM04_01535 [bacterium]|nr:hypothetical protein [bacterium]